MTRTRRILRPQFLLVPILLLTVLRPGDAPWVNDEPIMMEMAIQYNHTASNLYGVRLPFTPCPYGLKGPRAVYGPLPIWVDQLLLAVTHNPIVMVAWRAAVFTALTALAVSWLARTLKLSQWFAVVTMLSPWLWIYSRSLWDNTFCIPISAVLLAAYADFLTRRNAASLRIAVLCGVLLLFIHFMALALIVPLAAHLVWLHRASLQRWKWSLLAILAGCLFAFWPYVYFLFTHVHLGGSPDWRGWIYPLLGGHFLTLGVAGTMPGDGWQDFAPHILRQWFAGAQWISRAALAVVWLGMILALPRALHALRRPDAAGVREHLSLVGLCVWICQTLLDGLEGIYFSPHYYGATWLCYVFFAWMALEWAMARLGRGGLIVGTSIAIYAASILLGMGIVASTIARNGGTLSSNYGLALSNQIAAASQIAHFSDRSEVEMQVAQWRRYPLALKVLLELNPAPDLPRPMAHLVVKYRNAHPGDVHLEVEE